MENEKNEVTELTELKDYLKENNFSQSFIDLLEECFIANVLTMDDN